MVYCPVRSPNKVYIIYSLLELQMTPAEMVKQRYEHTWHTKTTKRLSVMLWECDPGAIFTSLYMNMTNVRIYPRQ